MLDQDYFALRLVRLKAAEEWSSEKEGLCFIFPKGGIGQYVNGSSAQRLAPGDIIVWEANRGAKLCVPAGEELIFWSFFARFEHLLPLFDGNEISLLHEVTDSFKDSKIFPSSAALSAKCHRLIEEVPRQFDLEHRSCLLRIAAAILDEEFRTAHHQRVGLGQVEERIIRIFEQLSVDQLLELSVDELAAKFGCSRRHLNRLFHQFFGFSVGALRMEMRLQKAVSLLRDNHAKVINVAAQCGFNHLGLFNTCFKKRFGLSPGRWRKMASQGKIHPAAVTGDDSACPLLGKGLCPMAGSFNTRVPPPAGISLIRKSPGSKPSPGLRAGERAVENRVHLTYPKASNSLPLRT